MTAHLSNASLRALVAALERNVEAQEELLRARWAQLKEAWAKHEADAAEYERWDRYYAKIENDSDEARERLRDALGLPAMPLPPLATLVECAIARMRPLEITEKAQP